MGLNNLFFIVQIVALVVVLLGLQIIRRTGCSACISRIQIVILLLYSYYFVAYADIRFAICIAIVTIIAYVCGRLTERFRVIGTHSIGERVVVVCGCTSLILILAYFKYTNFFIESINSTWGMNLSTLNLILPLGISFFTFSALSYVIDVYRCTCQAEKSIIDFALYMAFFAKITAGPIVRWTDFKMQVKGYRGIKLDALNEGIQIFVFGLFKKMVLADHLGVFVDDVFKIPNAFNTGTVILSAFSYSIQIYLDFSGYSDMAIGLAKILGFDFKPNFNLPYIARDFSDFWSRWHISLSQWFKDYLYIPLGGSRKGETRTYLNLLLVMLVSGIWHGAGWTFVLWGLLHGIASCVTRFINNRRVDSSCAKCIRGFEIALTFFFVTLFWVIFRAENVDKLIIYFKAMFTVHSGINQPYTWTFFSVTCIIVATVIAFARTYREVNIDHRVNGFYPILDLSKLGHLVVFFAFCGLTVLLGYYGNTAFIYGGF